MVANVPRVSICLPVFNGDNFLAAAIDSVLSQSFRDFELIVVDDCSTDQSVKLIESYAARDQRIKYSTNSEKLGLFGNYNRCMDLACGDYIKPFAQDDLLHGDMVQRLVELLDANPEVALASTARTPICYRGTRITDLAPQATASDYVPSSSSVSGREVIRKAINPVINFIGEPTTVMFRREYVGFGFDSSFCHLGDLEYWFRILLNGRYLYLDEELCSYRMHKKSTTATNQKYLLYASDLLRLGRKYKRFLWEAGGTQAQFNDQVIVGVAAELNARGDQFRSNLLNMDPEYFCEFDEYVGKGSCHSVPVGLLELALQALLRVPEARQPQSLDRRAVIYQLESTLENYLSSPSWKITRFLRELNKTLLVEDDDESLDTEVDSQIEYERYLRMQVLKVKRSRSWKITAPLRMAKSWLAPVSTT
jgi:glycosyltransferase involved in cell wall biosynthesis